MDEIERIKTEYGWRSKDDQLKRLWSALNEVEYFTVSQREKEIVHLLKRLGVNNENIRGMKLLDVGCGTGNWLQRLVYFGAEPPNLYGIDLMDDHIKAAKEKTASHIHYFVGNAESLPFSDQYFDILFQFTVFTSIIDNKVREKIAREMLRVLKPSGKIILYDFSSNIFSGLAKILRMKKKGKYNTIPIERKEIIRLFPNCEVKTWKIIPHPKIARISSLSWILAMLFGKLSFLNCYYLCLIEKKIRSANQGRRRFD